MFQKVNMVEGGGGTLQGLWGHYYSLCSQKAANYSQFLISAHTRCLGCGLCPMWI